MPENWVKLGGRFPRPGVKFRNFKSIWSMGTYCRWFGTRSGPIWHKGFDRKLFKFCYPKMGGIIRPFIFASKLF